MRKNGVDKAIFLVYHKERNNRKGYEKEEYADRLIRENDPVAERLFGEMFAEGSFGTRKQNRCKNLPGSKLFRNGSRYRVAKR